MRTSLIETEQIEAHLLCLSTPGDALVFEAKLILDDELRDKLQWQKSTYNLVKLYGRNQLKQEIEAVHQSLFSETRHWAFSEKIRQIFKKR
ncbi:hypothetical protein KXD93_10515 [Mucilaginibacter sp. BJC16-A38]|uniref:hypothetical protein n=1 Tax=Mucilaginibacter phenanthrenivorans TaxID=1234842 RepID=UPI0021587314|nr:hypothetical protein [Mucilaginibacter phenanthrenivorans]MCR8558079.1 hypothetical protein [Mucilaginibacter phenanthrenivorans]